MGQIIRYLLKNLIESNNVYIIEQTPQNLPFRVSNLCKLTE
ncbi:hypothetical protein OKW24_003769 [Peribacillus simplex]|nr:hypothetical protein [Peribacillus simplex]